MPNWINRTAGLAARNGTSSHTVSFTAAEAGRLLVAVFGSSATITPGGWTEQVTGLNSSEICAATKTATAGENSITVTMGATNYPLHYVIYEYPRGSTWVDGVSASNSSTFPTLSGLTGTNDVFSAVSDIRAPNGMTSAAWNSPWVEDYDASDARNGTDGVAMTVGYQEDFTGSSAQGSATLTGANVTREYVGFAVFVGDDSVPPVPLIEHISTGTAVAGTTSITTAAYPSGWDADTAAVNAGQVRIICSVASNHATTEATEPTVSGFTKIGTLNGGGGSQGTGTGNRRLTFFEKDAALADDTTPTVSLSGGNAMVAVFSAFQTTGTWDTTTAAFGAKTTAGTSWSQACTSDPGLDEDDMIVVGYAVRDDTSFSAMGVSATGATISSVTERADTLTTNGNDLTLGIGTADVTAGPSSAAPTVTATIGTSETGVVGALRLRATDVSSTDLVVDNAAHAQTSGTPTLTQVHELSVNGATQGQVSASPTLTQVHELVVQGATHAQTSASPALVVDLVVQSATQAMTSASPALTQTHVLSVDAAAQAQSAATPSLTQAHNLTVAGATQGHAAESPTLNTSTDLVVQNAAQAHTSDSPGLTQVHNLTVAGATHTQSADNADLSGAASLNISDAAHAQVAGNVTLTQTHVLAVDSAVQAHVVDSPTLTQQHVLAVDNAIHAHSAENAAVGAGLVVQNAAQAQSSGNVTLTQVHVLEVQDAVHAHASTTVGLAQLHLLTVAAAFHAHIAQNATVVDATQTWVPRPGEGVTARPLVGVTSRPDSGITKRPRIPYEP